MGSRGFAPPLLAWALQLSTATMHPTVPLQHSAPRALVVLSESAQTAAGMSGVFSTQLTPQRIGVSLTVVAFAILSLTRSVEETPEAALLAFAATSVARHAFMFASFTRNGIAPALSRRFGSESGFSIYESMLALLILAHRLSFVHLLLATASDPSGGLGTALVSSGAALVALGISVSIWATCVIGLDTYYYRDLYSGPRHVNFELRGPYAMLANPLYGVGQFAAYGAAVMVLSPIGVLAAAAHQVLLYVFNATVEQPHLRAATRLSVDTALFERLSYTDLDTSRLVDTAASNEALPPR